MTAHESLPFIVVVDDSEEDVLFLQQRFVESGIRNPVRAFSGGKRAIEYLARTCARDGTSSGIKLCLILLDLNMPGMGGLEVLKWARKQPALEPVTIAILSDSASPDDSERGYESGADHYLIKYPVGDMLTQIVADAMCRLSGG